MTPLNQIRSKLSAAAVQLSRLALGGAATAAFILPGMMMTAVPQTASAQVAPQWFHCSPNQGAVGPFYVIPPGVKRTGMFCTITFLAEVEATYWACYRNSRNNGPWPQMTSVAPIYGISAANFSC